VSRVLHLSVVHRHDDPRIFERECRTLAEAGHDVTYLAPGTTPGPRRDGVGLWSLKPRSRATRWLHTPEILRAVRLLQPDVVHFHDPELLALVPLLRRRVARIVYDIHEYHDLEVSGKYYIPAPLRPLAGRASATAHVRGVALCHGLVTVVDDQFESLGSEPALRVALPNYPRFSRFAGYVAGGAANAAPARPSSTSPILAELAADPRLKLIYVGSLTRPRGIPVMLDVLQRRAAEGHDDAMLYLGGVFYNPEVEAEVRGRVEGPQAPLAGRVKLLGRIAPDELPAYLAAADVVWVPPTAGGQTHRKLVTTKLYEGLAVGLAALVSDLPGRSEVVKEEDCGIAVPPGVDGHYEGLTRLLADRAAVRAYGARGRAAVEARYSWESIEGGLVEFYERLCAGLPDSG
jgi:hypothetical protein